MISDARRTFIRDGIIQGMRNDGRQLEDTRPIFVETQCIPHADGSAHIRFGMGTEVFVAVKLELEKQKEGTLELYIEGYPELGKLIYQWATETIDIAHGSLRVDENLHWRVLIDCVLTKIDGNILDCLTTGIAAAITSTEVPRLTVIHSGEGEYSVNVQEGFDRLNWDWPISISTAGFDNDIILFDPTREEELSSSYTIAVVIDSTGCVGVQCPLTSAGDSRGFTGPSSGGGGSGALLSGKGMAKLRAQVETTNKKEIRHVAMDPKATISIIQRLVDRGTKNLPHLIQYINKQNIAMGG